MDTTHDTTTHDTTHDEHDDTAACPACGDAIDYCRGHGPLGDPAGAAILAAHDDDEHAGCHPAGCEHAGYGTTEPGPSVYCRRHDMYRPCYWCTDAENGTDDDDTARLRSSYDPAPDAAAVLADRGAVSAPAAVVLAILAAVVLAILAGCSGPVVPIGPGSGPAATTTAPAVVTEDGPGWSCWWHGNGWCGPVVVVLAHDGTARVHDNPPADATDDDLAAAGLPVAYDPDPARLPGPCHGTDRPDGRGGPGRSGPVASVVVLASGPAAVTEDGSTRAAVVHRGPAGPCAGAVGTVVLY